MKTLDPDPAVIIQLLKTTQSERANYMIIGASYRRSGLPKSAKAIIETMIKGISKLTGWFIFYERVSYDFLSRFAPELGKRGVSESELKPAFLFLAGCESDLVRLSKASTNSTAVSEHYAAAQMWLQKVFGKADKKKKSPSLQSSNHRLSQTLASDTDRDNVGRLKREVQILRDQNAQQAIQLAELRSSKRKIEDDYYYERNLRRKY
jgi:hypothetical protein